MTVVKGSNHNGWRSFLEKLTVGEANIMLVYELIISHTSIIGYLSSLISIDTRHVSIKCQANLKQTSESSQKNLKNRNVNRSLVRGWRAAGYVATSRLDVDKPGDDMERRLQELLSTGRVGIVLARQRTSAVLHVVRRRWRNAVTIMQTVETADQSRERQRWKKTQTTSIISTFLQIRGGFFPQ